MTLVIDVNETTVADFDKSALEGFKESSLIDDDSAVYGVPGNDCIDAIGDNNKLYGDRGNDVIRSKGDGNELYAGGGEPSGDVLLSEGAHNLLAGSDESDLIVSVGDNNILRGAEGGDQGDTLAAFGSNNIVQAGSSDDTIISSLGGNELYGGAGGDTFIIDMGVGAGGEPVQIIDFQIEDKIVIRGATPNADVSFDMTTGLLTIGGQQVAVIGCPQGTPNIMFDDGPSTFGFDVCF